uniref:(California timema) hypothetical protein n=1 Tax=Timema californicum TaxID=61474 RepID=A0A7R9IWJ8_TIMCA|nr:unnamed protein product [Timema californicum]
MGCEITTCSFVTAPLTSQSQSAPDRRKELRRRNRSRLTSLLACHRQRWNRSKPTLLLPCHRQRCNRFGVNLLLVSLSQTALEQVRSKLSGLSVTDRAGTDAEESRLTAEEMDEIRQKNLAYEYLCHLEEAKTWLQAVLKEKLPPTTELEENLRNGVYLAKLANHIAPEVVPLSRIYDIEQKRYNIAGLQFRHTDNINYWRKVLEVSGLPLTFHPETTDVYDKKNMPRVVYCLHALSTHLFKQGKAPLIQDLYGKVVFTDAEIDKMRLELDKYDVHMPAFQKIGGILTNDMAGDSSALHAAVMDINEALDKQSMNDSYVADMYDEILTQAEIQGHIVSVNENASVGKINAALDFGTWLDLLKALQDLSLDLPSISEFAAPLYFEEMKTDKLDLGKDLQLSDVEASVRFLSLIAAVTQAVDMGNCDLAWDAIFNSQTQFMDLEHAFKSKYFMALKACRQQKLSERSKCPLLTYMDIQECIDQVNQQNEDDNQLIVALKQLDVAVKKNDASSVLTALQSPVFNIGENIEPDCAPLYIQLLKCKLDQKQNGEEEMALWLEDVQTLPKQAAEEIKDAHSACKTLSAVHSALKGNNQELLRSALRAGNLTISPCTQRTMSKFYNTLLECKRKKEMKYSCPWVVYQSPRNVVAYLNIETDKCVWKKPKQFQLGSVYLSMKDIKNVISYIKAACDSKVAEQTIVRLQALIRGYLIRKRVSERRKLFQNSLSYIIKIQEDKIVKVQALWRGYKARQAFLSIFKQPQPPLSIVKHFAPLLEFCADDYQRDLQLQNLKSEVVQAIRRNQELAKHLDAMDLKIGLLVRNRVTLQDVVAHGTTLNDLAKSSSITDPHQSRGLKSLTKESRKLLDDYQHLFYLLQTNPCYLSKLIFCLPPSGSNKFLQTVILSLFNFGANCREEYLLLKLFRSALHEEIRNNYEKLSDVMMANPLVLKLVVSFSRQFAGANSLRTILGPLVDNILTNKALVIDTNPVDIYKCWRSELEMKTGKTSDLPYSVNTEEALKYEEVRKRLASSLDSLKMCTIVFLERITQSLPAIPYGMVYMAKVLKTALSQKFPKAQEKDLLKVVGNLIYYQYINSAIVAPDVYDIINTPPNFTLSALQRRNLASIAKILQFAAAKKGFGDECQHLMCLNNFIVECHERFKRFFKQCCDVEELEEHFNVHEFSEATLISRPVIFITLQEICDTHKLLLEYQDHIAPDPMDPLSELLEDLGSDPSLATLLGKHPEDPALRQLAKAEACLTLVNKYEDPGEDDTDINKLFIKAKELLVAILPCLHGCNLVEALNSSDTPTQQRLFEELQARRIKQPKPTQEMNVSLGACKEQLKEHLRRLELEGMVSHRDGYQNLVTAVAQNICNKGRYRDSRRREMETLKAAKLGLEHKAAFYQDQVNYYNIYIKKCLENLHTGKSSVHTPKRPGNKQVKSKLTLKYTAARLHEKGVLLEVEGLPPSQLKNVLFEITPADINGIFTIKGKFMGVEMEKVDIDIQITYIDSSSSFNISISTGCPSHPLPFLLISPNFSFDHAFPVRSATVSHLDSHVDIKKMVDLVLEGIGVVTDILTQEVLTAMEFMNLLLTIFLLLVPCMYLMKLGIKRARIVRLIDKLPGPPAYPLVGTILGVLVPRDSMY